MIRRRKGAKKTQLELPIQRPKEKDRNFHKGGRSFYFFDFDDNIAFLTTYTYLFHKKTKEEVRLSSGEFARNSQLVGKSGPFKDFELNYDDRSGSFRDFRDREFGAVNRLLGQKQLFVRDLTKALQLPDLQWKGPSWDCFYHAVYNQRPIAIITARGHHPKTIKSGIRQMVKRGVLPNEPNYLGIYPVSHPETRVQLKGNTTTPIARLKQEAIREAVLEAFRQYGTNPHHRFGMSDDDPQNIALIVDEMYKLKEEFAENSFFVIETHGGHFYKREIFKDHIETQEITLSSQLEFFPPHK